MALTVYSHWASSEVLLAEPTYALGARTGRRKGAPVAARRWHNGQEAPGSAAALTGSIAASLTLSALRASAQQDPAG